MSLPAIGWYLYDLANTLFAINMTSYHFPVWVVSDRGGSEVTYSLAFGCSILVSAALMPWLGTRSDRVGGKIPALMGWTLGSVFFTAMLSWVSSLGLALVIFALANICYQIAGIFYNALLPVITHPVRIGRTSGHGVAFGYVGTLVGILSTAPILARWGRQATFFPTALLFLVLSLPCFFFVKENGAWHKNRETFIKFHQNGARHHLRKFLWASFWGLNAVSTVILFMSTYAKQAIGFNDATLARFLVTSTFASICGATVWGRLTDRIGGYRALWWVWATWALALGLAAMSFNPTLFWFLGCLAGVALGGTWVTSRVLIVEFVGAARVGEAFGLFGLVSRLSAVGGPILWGLILWLFAPLGDIRYRLGMVTLLGFVLIGWRLYHQLGVSPPSKMVPGTVK